MGAKKYLRCLTILTGVLSSGIIIFSSFPLQRLAAREWKVSLEFPAVENQLGAPPRSITHRAQRSGECVQFDEKGLTALMPSNNVGTTVAPNPTVYVRVPKIPAKSAEFSVYEPDTLKVIYVKEFPLPETPGIVKLSLPEHISLEIGKDYLWGFEVICDLQDRAANDVIVGLLRRTELSPEQKSKIKQATPLEQAKLYADAKIWNETLQIAALERTSHPDEWQQLLKSVGLENMVSEPFLDCCTLEK